MPYVIGLVIASGGGLSAAFLHEFRDSRFAVFVAILTAAAFGVACIWRIILSKK